MANVNVFFERYKKQIGIVLLLSLLLWSALRWYDKQHPKPDMAFWITDDVLNLSDSEENILFAAKGSPVYLHLMDIVWDDDKQFAFPTAQLKVEKPLPEKLALIPVIGISNEVFTHLDEEGAGILGEMIAARIGDKFTSKGGLDNNMQSILLDCEWTPLTKVRYFAFVNAVAEFFSCPVEVSIRPHQAYNLEKMGIPPVKRALLLYDKFCLPDGSVCTDPILSRNLGNDQQGLAAYPLPLDVGISLGSIGEIKRAENTVFIPRIDKSEIADTTAFQQINSNEYLVLEDGNINNVPVLEGETILVRETPPAELKNTLSMLKKQLRKEKRIICFLPFDQSISDLHAAGKLAELLELMK